MKSSIYTSTLQHLSTISHGMHGQRFTSNLTPQKTDAGEKTTYRSLQETSPEKTPNQPIIASSNPTDLRYDTHIAITASSPISHVLTSVETLQSQTTVHRLVSDADDLRNSQQALTTDSTMIHSVETSQTTDIMTKSYTWDTE